MSLEVDCQRHQGFYPCGFWLFACLFLFSFSRSLDQAYSQGHLNFLNAVRGQAPVYLNKCFFGEDDSTKISLASSTIFLSN